MFSMNSPRATHIRRLLQHALLYATKCVFVFLFRLRSFRLPSRVLTPSSSSPPQTKKTTTTTTTTTAQQGAAAQGGGGGSDFRALIPPGSWDSHMHVLDPRFPLDPSAVYQLSKFYTSPDAKAFERDVAGLLGGGVVIVQPSIYGHDNACTLSALRALGGPERARAVVSFDPATLGGGGGGGRLRQEEILKEWHDLGVRGVRLNLQSGGAAPPPRSELEATVRRYADAVRPLGWVLQIYASLPIIAMLEPLLLLLLQGGVRVCIDHMGHPDLQSPPYAETGDPYAIPGFPSLVRLLEAGNTWVKLSAAYRFSASPDGFSDALPVARELLRVAGRTRVVFATDWPHTRFDGLDIRPWIRTVLFDLCQRDEALIERVFRGNAEELWSASPTNASLSGGTDME